MANKWLCVILWKFLRVDLHLHRKPIAAKKRVIWERNLCDAEEINTF